MNSFWKKYWEEYRGWLILSGVFFLLLFFAFPVQSCRDFAVEKSIGDALQHGLNWGRQCLVGSVRYPLLPTLALWLCCRIAAIFGTSGELLLIRFCVFGCGMFVFRWYFHRKLYWKDLIGSIIVLCCICGLVRVMHFSFCIGVEAFLWTGFLYYLFCYYDSDESKKRLLNLVLAACFMGCLALCGGLILLSAGILLYIIQSLLQKEVRASEGARINFCLPFIYGLFLIFVLNWFVMGDAFYFVRAMIAWASSCSWVEIKNRMPSLSVLWQFGFAQYFIFLLLLWNKKTAFKGRVFIMLLVLLQLNDIFASLLGFDHGAMRGYPFFLAIGAISFLIKQKETWNSIPKRLLFVVLMILLMAQFLPIKGRTEQGGVGPLLHLENRQKLEAFVDQYWPDSRILLLGDRLPAEVQDYQEKRYLSRLDYQPHDILAQSDEEQLYLLLPPPSAGYYPAKNNALSDIYYYGAPWLLLEKVDSGGWQLLRVVPPPKGESKLEKML